MKIYLKGCGEVFFEGVVIELKYEGWGDID